MNLSIYLHFPFCKNHCSYCDFYKELYVQKTEQQFYASLIKETELASRQFGDTFKEIQTIFIGGGTPSMSNLDLFERWLETLGKYFHIPDGIEFSLEANPESINVDNLKRLKQLGVTRPTFGLQSFNPEMLNLLTRRHNPHDSQQAIYLTNALGYKTFGVDLIFGVPTQTSRMLSADIDHMLDLNPPHISFYQLTLEEGTLLAKQVADGELAMPEPELLGAMYQGGCKKLTDAGYERYEVSSFAKPGHECRHNIGYWEGRDYLGLGPSAHSFINNERFYNLPNLSEYIKAIDNNELPRVKDESGVQERMTEAIYLGLRTQWGVSRADFAKRFGRSLDETIDSNQISMLVESGHLENSDDRIKLTDHGVLVADEITKRLLK